MLQGHTKIAFPPSMDNKEYVTEAIPSSRPRVQHRRAAQHMEPAGPDTPTAAARGQTGRGHGTSGKDVIKTERLHT